MGEVKYNEDGTPQMPDDACRSCGHDTFEVGLVGRADASAVEVTEDTIEVWDTMGLDVDIDDMALAVCMNCGRTYEVVRN